MPRIVYFAYGSNMSTRRLRARIASADPIGTGVLHRYSLVFHKVGRKDGSGKCDLIECRSDYVLGVLFEFDTCQKPVLDRVEGLGAGYAERIVKVETESGQTLSAYTYIATLTDPALQPFGWYKRHVLEGAMEAGLTSEYIARIKVVPADEDPDKQREMKELAIYQ